jgi:predicted GNAT family N-acyltransferase
METLVEVNFSDSRERILGVRFEVFVEEQGVPEELEQDDKDPLCRHALLISDDVAIATGRLQDDGHIGRIAVLREHRGKGAGSRILAFLESIAKGAGLGRVYLGAQVHAIPFYEKLGYRCYGETFLDAGIVHRYMQKMI